MTVIISRRITSKPKKKESVVKITEEELLIELTTLINNNENLSRQLAKTNREIESIKRELRRLS